MLRFASSKLQADREVVLAAVKQNGGALAFASDDLLFGDREVMLAAVTGNPCGIMFASKELCADREIVLTATMLDGFSLSFASDKLQDDPYLQSWARLTDKQRRWRKLRRHAMAIEIGMFLMEAAAKTTEQRRIATILADPQAAFSEAVGGAAKRMRLA